MRDGSIYRKFSGTSARLVIALVLFTPRLSEAQSVQHRDRFLHWAYQDAALLARQANWQTPLWIIGSAGLLFPVTSVDEIVNPQVQKWDTGTFGHYLDFVNEFGGPRATMPVIGIFAASLLTNNTRLQDAAFTSLQALVYANILSYSLKYATGRMRPLAHEGAYQFEPFSGHSSFPSGHTVTAFAVLTSWVLYYPNAVTYGLFAISSGTALARLARDKHWTTDVLAGGAIGFLTAYWLTRQHQSRTPHISVAPTLSANTVSLCIRVNL